MDVFVLPEFLDPATCDSILGAMREGEESAASVYGHAADGVHASVRRATRVTVSTAIVQALVQRLETVRPRLAEHFALDLSRCEEPQLLHYRAGDFFVAHQDGNTALTVDDTRHRRVSVVVFLNDGYGGGELLFHGAYPDWLARHRAPASAGALVAFRSETTHEVTPVAHGERYTIATWFR